MPRHHAGAAPAPLSRNGPPGMDAPQHLRWNAEGLWQQLQPLLPGLSVEVLARCDSTNTRLLERARAAAPQRGSARAALSGAARASDAAAETPDGPGAPGRRAGDAQPCLLVAEHQTHGRGRLGREWHAAPGASLTMSLALPLAPREWSGLSLAVGLALAEALDPAVPTPATPSAPPRLWLKWPNDLYFCNAASLAAADPVGRAAIARKLGGILIETVALGAQRMAVIGIGLNVQAQPELPPAWQAQPDGSFSAGSACLQELDPQATAPAVLHRIALPLVQAVLAFERDGFAPGLAGYARRDLLAGCTVTTGQPGGESLDVLGVEADGALRVRAAGAGPADAAAQRLISGEVSVRLDRGASGSA
jgi:BirA family transcriptional regulator, biotin operon repressor / biotin---[acetyl-CoA-carboxylase] ligase